MSVWLLARTASRIWARCCNARAVRNSESLRELDAALLERRGWWIDIPVLTVCWVNRAGVDLVASPYSKSYVGQMLQC